MANPAPGRSRLIILIVGICAIGILVYFGCLFKNRLTPEQKYQKMVSAFYSGVVAMNVGDNEHAGTFLRTATSLYDNEPAAWANLGLYNMRMNDLPAAQQALDKAHTLKSNNEQIELFLGLLAQKQSKSADAVTHYQRATMLAPDDVKAHYALSQVLPPGDPQVRAQLEQILQLQPNNLFVQLQLAAVAAKENDLPQIRAIVAQIAPQTTSWPTEAKSLFADLKTAAAGTNARGAATQVAYLVNTLGPADVEAQPVPAYGLARTAVGGDVSVASKQIGQPLEHFLVLPTPSATPAPPDLGLTFAPEAISPAPAVLAGAAWLVPPKQDASGGGAAPGPSAPREGTIVVSAGQAQVTPPSGTTTTVAFPKGARPPTADAVLGVDLNNDFGTDLVMASAGGIRLYQQKPDATFQDVTASAKLPPALLGAPYTGAWTADIDTDGDLDVIVGTDRGLPTILRNNSDGTFTPIQPFHGAIQGLHGWAWADLDNDGLPDAAFVDAQGRVFAFENSRSGVFAPWPLPKTLGQALAVTAADVDRDGQADLIVLGRDGTISRLSRTDGAGGWSVTEIAHWTSPPTDGSARLLWADLDNNGGLDLIATGSGGTQVWLSGVDGSLQPLAPLDVRHASVEDPGTGRLGLIGLSPTGRPIRLVNRGTKNYGWQNVRLRALVLADHRNNTYGVGGQIGLRAGLLYEGQTVTGPVTHFGLGAYRKADYVRIVWTNGNPQCPTPGLQGEFEPKSDEIFDAPERLCGSCPWLFADDGHGMKFITDVIWRSPLGLRINAQNTAGVAMTRDRVRIAGSQLAPIDGALNLSVTAELWETHFFDYFSLLAVDHPAGTDVYADERFAVPPPPLALRALTLPRPVARAVDDRGQDVTDIVRVRDSRYLDTFGRGLYQGVTRDHYVEVTLADAQPRSGRSWLLAEGWIHPTDSSINLALSQGKHMPPHDLSLEIPDGRGGWRVARPHLGFPAGKNKTILIDLTGLFPPGRERRLRLRTNLEIYWDWLASAAERPAATLKVKRLNPLTADLRYRGFSATRQANASSPEIPLYDRVNGTGPLWLDLVGYYTRFGDVRPLVRAVDDRYVIMNAGDELRLRFPVPPPPPQGWVRDYVLETDGWEKDGNFNTGFSKTVLPLPSHDRPDYNTPPGRLADDPVYQRHRQDWQTYQTRYVTSAPFQKALLPRK